MDINEPVTNPSLVEAMRRMRENENQTTIQAMVNAVLEAHFLAPVEMQVDDTPDEKGAITLKKDTKMSFYTLQTQKQERYLMAFTDWEQLHRWRKGEHIKTVVMQFDDYAAMILAKESGLAGFVINGFGENIPFPTALIRSLKERRDMMEQGHSEHIVKEGERIQLGEPKEYPHAMVAAMTAYMKSDPQIHAAYLRLMRREEELSWLVAVDHDGIRQHVFAGIADAARPHVNGMFIDIMELDGLGAHALDEVEPFYAEANYRRPLSVNVAVIEDIFAMKKQGCVLGCYLKQGSFQVHDEVEVLDGRGERLFHCVIDGLENTMGKQNQVMAGEQESRAGILILNRDKEAFLPGYQLRKKIR